jgi:hypothetical protein
MPKQAFKFDDREVTKMLGDHLIKTGMIPMARYDVQAMVSLTPGVTGFTITVEVEKAVDKTK